MNKEVKTNAMRLLDRASIHYDVLTYEPDPNDLSAPHVAETLGLDVSRVFKTLVLCGARTGHFVCVVPGNSEIDLKLAAQAAADKSCAMIPMKELLSLTGYIRGGCTCVGMKKPMRVFFDSTALDFDHIYVSGGRRGLQLRIGPRQLIDYVHASVAPLTR